MSGRARLAALAAMVVAATPAFSLGCSVPDATAVEVPTLPTQQGFPYVAQVMEYRCGSIDCHGSVSRNLRIYGDEGLRFSGSDQPCVPKATTSVEVGQDFASIVDLEPEEMSAVVGDHGANPERLSMIAKPLGIEGHMGGTVFHTGDDTYACLTSWLAGQTNTTRCLAVLPGMLCGEPSQDSFDAGAD